MSANVIQHTGARRKRAGAWSWTTRHLLLLVVVVAGIIAASWLAPEATRPTPDLATTSQPERAPAAPTVATPDLPAVDIATDLAGPPTPVQRVRQTARQTGIPLDAAVTPADNYEILSAAELDGISQARN